MNLSCQKGKRSSEEATRERTEPVSNVVGHGTSTRVRMRDGEAAKEGAASSMHRHTRQKQIRA